MNNNLKRLKNINGQLTGIARMIESKQDPLSVLTQMKAARAALNSVMTKYIQENFWEFINECDDKEDSCKKFLEEIIQTT